MKISSDYNNYNSANLPDSNSEASPESAVSSNPEEMINSILQDHSLNDEAKYHQLIEADRNDAAAMFARIAAINSNPYLSDAQKDELISQLTQENVKKRLLFEKTIAGLEILPPSREFRELLETLQLYNKKLSELKQRGKEMRSAEPQNRPKMLGIFVSDFDSLRITLDDIALRIENQIQADPPVLSPWQKVQLQRNLEANGQLIDTIRKELRSSR